MRKLRQAHSRKEKIDNLVANPEDLAKRRSIVQKGVLFEHHHAPKPLGFEMCKSFVPGNALSSNEEFPLHPVH